MDDTEAVGDERVAELGELRGECLALGLVLAGLPRVEPEVLEQGDVAVFQAGDRLARAAADGVPGEGHRLAEQLAEPLGDRREAVLRVRCALRAAEVGDDDDLRALVDQGVQGGNRRSHAAIVRDLAVLQGTFRSQRTMTALAGERTE